MNWLKYPENKPKDGSSCWVINNRWGSDRFEAIYMSFKEVFWLYDPNKRDHPCLDVTHFIEIPEPPKD